MPAAPGCTKQFSSLALPTRSGRPGTFGPADQNPSRYPLTYGAASLTRRRRCYRPFKSVARAQGPASYSSARRGSSHGGSASSAETIIRASGRGQSMRRARERSRSCSAGPWSPSAPSSFAVCPPRKATRRSGEDSARPMGTPFGSVMPRAHDPRPGSRRAGLRPGPGNGSYQRPLVSAACDRRSGPTGPRGSRAPWLCRTSTPGGPGVL